MSNVEAWLYQELLGLSKRLTHVHAESQQLRSQRDEMFQHILEIDGKLRDPDVGLVKGKGNTEQLTRTQQELRDALAEVDKLSLEVQRLHREKRDVEDGAQRLQQEAQQAAGSTTVAHGELERLHAEVERVNVANAQLAETCGKLKQQLDEAHASTRDAHADMARMRQDLERLHSEKLQLSDNCHRLQLQIDSTVASSRQLEDGLHRDLTDLKYYHAREVNDLTGQVDYLQQQLGFSKHSLEQLRQENARMVEHASAADAGGSRHAAMLSEQIRTLQMEKADAVARIINLEGQLAMAAAASGGTPQQQQQLALQRGSPASAEPPGVAGPLQLPGPETQGAVANPASTSQAAAPQERPLAPHEKHYLPLWGFCQPPPEEALAPVKKHYLPVWAPCQSGPEDVQQPTHATPEEAPLMPTQLRLPSA